MGFRSQAFFYKDLYKHWLRSKFSNSYAETYDNSKQIPKTIHYAWFGHGEKNEILKKCLATWPQQLKDYNIVLWDEKNFPFEKYPFAQQAYEQKKWAFVADVARLHAIYYYGGIYMDTDVEVLKPFDDLLNCDAFACYETPNLITIGTLGAKPKHPWVGLILLWYQGLNMSKNYNEIANTRIISRMMRLHYKVKLNGKEMVFADGVHLYPREYFCPDKEHGVWKTSEDTYCIHHFTGLW
ncbi:MAG: glycosyl transferase [Clostridia bacterium]|nr:glycosyl transferase [Clostridia bacterium]NCC99918.1 glycosyl transferase [Bacteroidia bacterium]